MVVMSVLRFLWRLLKLSFVFMFYATPLVGFWLASSLAAYLAGPPWLAWTAGLVVFPVLPLAWEARARLKSARKREDWIFTTAQRLSLRTFLVSLAWLGTLIVMFPRTAFVSLSTRGDWMLDGVRDPRADVARRTLFATADGLEWLYRLTKKNPYEAFVENQADRLVQLLPGAGAECPQWPWKQSGLHPLVAKMPASEETSYEAVARYIARNESDPFLRVKALHDWVADRIVYDAEALRTRNFPPQDAKTVFRTRIGVCAGYSNLLAAMGEVINEKIVVVTGDARDENNKISGVGHAWNAARIEGHWYLIDATWDAGSVGDKGFVKEYSSEYLCPPPRAMVLDHFPKVASWQLLDRPLSQGEFLRQPMLRPAWFAAKLELISPTRAQTEVGRKVSILVKNPTQQWLMMVAQGEGTDAAGQKPPPSSAGTALLECALPGPGRYRVKIFMNAVRDGRYSYVGALEFVSS
jgi:hypothetical protein